MPFCTLRAILPAASRGEVPELVSWQGRQAEEGVGVGAISAVAEGPQGRGKPAEEGLGVGGVAGVREAGGALPGQWLAAFVISGL